jgi:cobyric acid synthase
MGLFTACQDDRDSNPTIQQPTTFVLNTPAVADQYIQLSADNKVNLTWSQPNYGYNALATYQIQVGLVNDDGSIKWSEEDGAAKYLETTFTQCNVNVSGAEIAETIVRALAGKKGLSLKPLAIEDHRDFKEKEYDRLADVLRASMDIDMIYDMLKEAAF